MTTGKATMSIKLSLAIASLLAAGQAMAQSADVGVLEEIVVTAQRREQRLQDVPAAITSLSGENLNRRNLRGNADLVARVPSLTLDVQGPGESTLSIRGVGTAYGLAPAVSYYLNETPLDIRTDGSTGVQDVDFFDVERVEVLRGPQGTLYGSSSMGGALRVLTAQPDPTGFSAKAETGISTMSGGGAGYLGKAAVNVPLSDRAAIRFVGAYEHVPGYVDRAVPGDWFEANPDLPISDREINDADLLSGRILGLIEINDKVKVTPSIWYSEIDASGASEYHTNLPRFTTAGTYPTPANSTAVNGNLLVEADLGFASLMSSSSVLTRDVDNDRDLSLLMVNLAPLFGLPAVDYPTLDRFTTENEGLIQEFRLTSPADQRLSWVAGAYFSRFEQDSEELLDSEEFTTAIGQVDDTSLYTFNQEVIDRQSAVFVDLTYAATPKLDLTVGARYYELRSSLENVQTGILAAPNQPLVRADASGTSPRAVVAYRPTDDFMLYATAARGYRPGGPNVGLPDGIGCELVDAYQPLYDPDSVWNYELGAKAEFMQRRLSVNVALYQIDWEDVQQAVADPGCGYIIVANVGEAESRGAELEIVMRPIDNLTLAAAASYTDAEFTSIADAYQLASAATPGDPLPGIPETKFNVDAQYGRDLGDDRSWFIRADWTWIDSVPTGFTTQNTRPSYSSIGATAAYRFGRYEVSLYGRNLTDEDGIVDISEGATTAIEGIFWTQISTPPRTIGLNLAVDF
jgi:outer membrane receptor protein involved in Fe transport